MISLFISPVLQEERGSATKSLSLNESSPDTSFVPSATGGIWQDDCSNTTGWISQSAATGFDPKHEILQSGALTAVSDYLYVDGISNPAVGRQGPLYVKQLDSNVSISSIRLFQAEVEFLYSFDVYGWLSVYLFDEDKQKVAMLRLHDAWQSTSSIHEAVYFTPGEIGDGTVFDEWATNSWRATISCWYDSATDSIQAEIDDGTTVYSQTLESSGNFDSQRNISYIGIQWSKQTTFTYTGNYYRLHNILFDYSIPNPVTTWHDDCTNTTGWIYAPSWEGYRPWAHASGTLTSTSGYLHVPDNAGWATGPLWYQQFSNPMPVNSLNNWEVTLDMNQLTTSYKGRMMVILYDANKDWVTYTYAYDWHDAAYDGNLVMAFRMDNGSTSALTYYDIPETHWQGTFSFYYSSGVGLIAEVDGKGSRQLLDEATWLNQTTREISYIGITWNKGSGTYMDIRLQDMLLETSEGITIDSPADIEYEEGFSLPQNITWNPVSAAPDSYEVYKGGVLDSSGSWIGSDIVVDVGGFTSGIYNYTLRVNNTAGAFATDTVNVTVVSTADPELDTPVDVYLELGTNGTITWHPNDTSPSSYDIYVEEVNEENGIWSGGNISYVYVGDTIGAFNVTIKVTDALGNYATDSVNVYVQDTLPPTIDSPSNITLEDGMPSSQIIWNPNDANPSSYELYIDDVSAGPQIWDGSAVSTTTAGLGVGNHNLTLVVYDIDSNNATDSMWVEVIPSTPPSVSGPASVDISEGSSGEYFTWTASDLYPDFYDVFRNGSNIIQGATWFGGDVSVSLDGLSLGDHNYTIILTDQAGNTAVDTVWVHCFDTSNPNVNSPADIDLEYGMSDIFLIWTIQDLHLLNWQVYLNSSPHLSGDNQSASVIVDLDGLSSGVHNLTVIVFDTSNNNASDSVMVLVAPSTAPIIDDLGDFIVYIGQINLTLIWHPYDSYPEHATILLNETEVYSAPWSGGPISYILPEDLEIGLYVVTIAVTDLAGNSAGSYSYITILDNASPLLTDNENIDWFSTDASPFTVLSWSAYDLSPNKYTILIDGVEFASGSWAIEDTISFSFPEELDWGDYNITIVVEDTAGNLAIDTVMIRGVTAVDFESPGDIIFTEGSSEILATWNLLSGSPEYYWIMIDYEIVDSGVWSDVSISVILDSLAVGIHEVSLSVQYMDEYWYSDSIQVTVLPDEITTIPTDPGNQMGDIVIIGFFIAIGGIVIVIVIIIFLRKQSSG